MALPKETPGIEPDWIADINPADRINLAGFWLAVIQPILESAQAKTVVEVGAEDGYNTANLLAYCTKQQGHLYIIEPLPKFDVEAYRHQFGPIFTLHQNLSLNILPRLGQFDAILLDGDHNWYTVYHELKQIEAAHRANPAAYPLIFLHDVEWPYARRDMYYQPDTIPAEYRQPYAQLGILPGQMGLSWGGGLNHHLNNAEHEGGEKNGVLTAVEDFLAKTELEFKFVHLPVSRGLGILIASARLQAQPALRQRLAEVTSEAAVAALQTALTDPADEALLQWQARPYQLLLQQTLNKRLRPETTPPPKPRISMIVVLHNMRREAERTLYSLSARYQQEVNETDYEVIVVENGSTEPLENTDLSRFGPNFSYHYLPTESPSPVEAINFGADLARGDYLGIMIDGAHILTPGVLKYAQLLFEIYRNPLGVVRIFHLGHDAQPATLRQGYSRQVEDALLDQIDWPQAGYRLFEIGRLVYSNELGWFHPVSESNCLFVKREIFAKLGGYDASFKQPGGGVVNIDFYTRAIETAEAAPVVILGEGSFHQTHGGVTSSPSPVELKNILTNLWAEYRAIRGKPLASFPPPPLHFVGHMPPPASFELAQNHNRMQQELTEKERQIKQLAGVCAEREALIHQLSTICTEREAVIQQLADSRNRNIIRRLADKLSKFMRWQGIA